MIIIRQIKLEDAKENNRYLFRNITNDVYVSPFLKTQKNKTIYMWNSICCKYEYEESIKEIWEIILD